MHSDTDEEGYPRLKMVVPQTNRNPLRLRRLFRSTTYQISEDHENGETTGQRVIVLRRLPQYQSKSPEISPLWSDCDIRERLALHLGCVTIRNPMPTFQSTHPSCPKTKCAAPRVGVDNGKRSIFRIPKEQHSPETLTKNHEGEKIILVSIWKEFYYGDKIVDVSPEKVRADLQAFRSKPCCTSCLGNSCRALGSYLPIKLMLILCAIIKCVLCKITIPLAMYYRAHKHAKIHRSCDERGIRPVFTGSASQGPLIYGVRKFCCQYCSAQRQSDDSLKLLEMLNKERKLFEKR